MQTDLRVFIGLGLIALQFVCFVMAVGVVAVAASRLRRDVEGRLGSQEAAWAATRAIVPGGRWRASVEHGLHAAMFRFAKRFRLALVLAVGPYLVFLIV